MKKILSLVSYCYLTKKEMLLAFVLLTAAFCAVRMEMLLAEAKYSSSSILLIEKPTNEVPINSLVEEEFVSGEFFQKNDDQVSLLVNTAYLNTH